MENLVIAHNRVKLSNFFVLEIRVGLPNRISKITGRQFDFIFATYIQAIVSQSMISPSLSEVNLNIEGLKEISDDNIKT